MSNKANSSHGDFVWYELLATSPKSAIAFYEHVIGWSTRPMEGTDQYTLLVSDQGPLGGATQLSEQAKQMGAPPHWISDVQVDSVDATVATAKKLGARVYLEPTDYPGVGRFAVLADPAGASISVFTPAQPMKSRDRSKSGEVCWHELLAEDLGSALEFYGKLFGWAKRSVVNMGEMGDYILFGDTERDFGGMFKKPKNAPAAWLYYVEVSDLDAAIERAKVKGGKLCHGPMEVPGGARIAQLSDPEGAMFALHESRAAELTKKKTA
jgi:uncharacterized protein